MSLELHALKKRLGGRRVLTGLSLTLERGLLAVLGANGCGKTTLLRIVAGVLPPDEGSVKLHGRALDRSQVGYVPEGADPPPHLTVAELLALVASLRRAAPLSAELVDRLGIAAIRAQRISSLSLGQRRRACLGAALIGDPWLLVLDEPTNGLDPGGVDMLAALLREHAAAGRAALVATHDLDFVDAIAADRLRF